MCDRTFIIKKLGHKQVTAKCKKTNKNAQFANNERNEKTTYKKSIQ